MHCSIRVAIADESLLFAEALHALLSGEPDIEVIGSTTRGDALLRLLRSRRPDVAVIGRRLADGCALGLIDRMRHLKTPVRVVLIASELSDEDAVEAVRVGASGVLMKSMPAKLLKQCIRQVHSGGHWVEKESIHRAMRRMLKMEGGLAAHARTLTARELDVLRLVAKGFRSRDVAGQLFISEATVKVHLSNVYRKLGVKSRVELSLHAQRNGLI